MILTPIGLLFIIAVLFFLYARDKAARQPKRAPIVRGMALTRAVRASYDNLPYRVPRG